MWNSSGSRSKKRGGSSSQKYSSSSIDEEAAAALFAEIADEEDPTVAGMEGISTLCEKLDIDPLEDIRILVLLWKLGSKEKPAQISKEEWMRGCESLQVDSLEKFKEMLPSLDTGFLDQTDFRDFYKVIRGIDVSLFDFCHEKLNVTFSLRISLRIVLLSIQFT